MKKYLLGALFVLGTMSYANQHLTQVDASGNAKANVKIRTFGKVVPKNILTLVVQINSGAGPAADEFALDAGSLFIGDAANVNTKGDFEVYLLKDGTKVKFADAGTGNNNLTVALEPRTAGVALSGLEPIGNGGKGLKVAYTLIGGNGSAAVDTHIGSVEAVITGIPTDLGIFREESANLVVEVKNQKLN